MSPRRSQSSIPDQRGFTLVELLVVTALFVVVGGLGIGFFLATLSARAKAEHVIDVQENGRLALQRISYEIRRANGIALTSDFGVNLAATPGDTLDLDMPNVLTDPTTFDVVNGTLFFTQGTDAPVALTTSDVTVTNLTFDNRSSTNGLSQNIKVTLTLDHAAGAAGELGATTTLSTTLELRGR